MQVNRHLKDRAFDMIDHALGRPANPMVESYRNHYAVYSGSPEIDMLSSPNWEKIATQGDMIFYRVTDAGRSSLGDYLASTGDKHRLFFVTYEGQQSSVVGTSHGNAKYRHWLNISDCLPDMKYIYFARQATVRVAAS